MITREMRVGMGVYWLDLEPGTGGAWCATWMQDGKRQSVSAATAVSTLKAAHDIAERIQAQTVTRVS